MPKRGERVAAPAPPGGWEVRYATSDAVKGWEELCQMARSALWDAWVVLSERPTATDNLGRQHKLRGKRLSSRVVHGKALEQWQYEVTSGGRIFYCPDPEVRIVRVVEAGTGHPKITDQ